VPRGRKRAQTVPGIYLYLLCEVVRRLGHDPAALLAGLDIDQGTLTSNDSRIPAALCGIALSRALALSARQGLGFEYARALRITQHGPLGLGVLSSLSFADAIDLARRYLALRAPFLSLDLRREGNSTILELAAQGDWGPLQVFLMEALLLHIVFAAEQILGRPASQETEMWMRGPEPAYYARFRDQLPLPIRYDKPACQLRSSLDLASQASPLADPIAAQQVRAQLDAELQELLGGHDDIVSEIRRQLRAARDALPTLEEMATAFFMSSRTLKRRLQELGVSFRDLVDEELKTRACDLLSSTTLPVSEIAYRLGYGDVSNFGRAFRRWTGLSPKDYRNGVNP
jgi:AraC-like DNA-binding protein